MYTFSAGRKYRVSVLMPILLQCCQEPRGAGIFYEYLTFFLRKGLINTAQCTQRPHPFLSLSASHKIMYVCLYISSQGTPNGYDGAAVPSRNTMDRTEYNILKIIFFLTDATCLFWGPSTYDIRFFWAYLPTYIRLTP